MNGTSGFQEVRSSTPDHHHIGYGTSNGIDSEQVSGNSPHHDLIALSTDISRKREEAPGAIFMPRIGSVLRQTLFKNRVEKVELKTYAPCEGQG